MKRRYILISIIVLLIITNLAAIYFCFLYKAKYQQEKQYGIEHIYFLEGENSNWKFDSGILILGRYREYFNGETLEYIGKNKLETNHMKITVNIKDPHTNIVKNTLFNVIHDARNIKGSNIMRDKKIILGESKGMSEMLRKYNFDLKSDDYVCIVIEYNVEGEDTTTEELRLNVKPIDLSKFRSNKF